MKKKARTVRFGIRFKFSLIMIAGVTFTAGVLALAIFKQQEKTVNESLLKWGTSILNAPRENSERFLKAEQLLYSGAAAGLSPWQRFALAGQMNESRKRNQAYFSSIVGKEPGIDIAFLISIRWSDLNDWNRWDQSLYRYYDRRSGNLFSVKGGRVDYQLKPSIYAYYMNNLELDGRVTFTTTTSGNATNDYIILGLPLFRNSTDIYREYLASRKGLSISKEDRGKRKAADQRLARAFMDRIMARFDNFDYTIRIRNEKDRRAVYALLLQDYSFARLAPAWRTRMTAEFNRLVDSKSVRSGISVAALRSLFDVIRKKYALRPAAAAAGRGDPIGPGNRFYMSLGRYGIGVEPLQKLDELALISYRTDIIGIEGIFLTQDVFYAEIYRNRKQILDLILSVLLRCAIIALFFPTFIIRSVSTLAEGADRIGRGDFDAVIEMKGSDEIGRLADILNVMTKNLKKARDEMVDKRRMEDELLTAREIQAALLPRELPSVRGVEFGAYYSAQTESGGDYYDFIPIGDAELGIAIADVSGHGVGAGLVMAMTRTLLHVHCKKSRNNKELLSILNEYLYDNTDSNYFVTMFYAVLDLASHELRYSSAGHMRGIVLKKNALTELEPGGVPLGAAGGDLFDPLVEIRKADLARGDYLVQYTDGVVESMDAGRAEYGEERFHRALLMNYGKRPGDLIDAVMADINRFTGRIPQHDDVTMIVVRIS